MLVTALPTIAQMVGANRILRGVAITHPTGDPGLDPDDERALRVAIARRAARHARHRGRGTDRVGGRHRDPSRRRDRLVLRARPRPRPRAARFETESRAGAAEPPSPGRCEPSTTRWPIRRTRCSSDRSQPEDLWDRPRAWWRAPDPGGDDARAHSATSMSQAAFYELLGPVDHFDLVRPGVDPGPDALALFDGDDVIGAIVGDHDARRVPDRAACSSRTCRSRPAACMRCATCSSAPASTPPRSRTRSAAVRRPSAIDTSAAAATSPRRSPRSAGSTSASGVDVKSFCAAPVHALVVAAALIEAGIEERVVVSPAGRSASSA